MFIMIIIITIIVCGFSILARLKLNKQVSDNPILMREYQTKNNFTDNPVEGLEDISMVREPKQKFLAYIITCAASGLLFVVLLIVRAIQ